MSEIRAKFEDNFFSMCDFCGLAQTIAPPPIIPARDEQVECPDELYDALVKAWDQNPQYVDVCDIIVNEPCDDDQEEEDEDEDGQDPTLIHTFYR